MGLRFSEDGPEFPTQLIDDLLEGRVVFFCGAGVSTPPLPGFQALVNDVYAQLGLDRSDGEVDSINGGRFEEALGSVARRLANPQGMHKAVQDRLSQGVPLLDHHKTLLRLSRGLDNRLALVTTNFDTYFERALEETEGVGRGALLSLAGQALPPPGSTDFCGVIHLHGRLADTTVGVPATPLILTSAEYGDAYMRSGWASRFLFDLARCRTIVLVGYRAGDAPIRYFLNVLEADRTRFRDVKPVYALDEFEGPLPPVDDRWTAVAVQRLSFRLAPNSQPDRYAALWRDLGHLADFVEAPQNWRRGRATAILSKPFDDANARDLTELGWTFSGSRDLWDVVIASTQDPRWFDYFNAQKLWDDTDASRVLAAWCSLDWADPIRLQVAVEWYKRLGRTFGQVLQNFLESKPPEIPLLVRAWTLLARSEPLSRHADLDAFRLTQRLRKTQLSEEDLRAGVQLLTPKLEFSERIGETTADRPQRVTDLVWVRMRVDDLHGGNDLRIALARAAAASERLISITTEALERTIAQACDADLIGDGWDTLDSQVQSVEPHAQNRYRDGPVFLTELLTSLLPAVAKLEVDRARDWARRWRDLRGLLGQRLWLYALRQPSLFTADDVAKALIAMPEEVFWSVRRELILTIEERLGQAETSLVDQVCNRILSEGPRQLADLPDPKSGENDWRPQVRDRDIWLRLTALQKANALPARGARTLGEIAKRHPSIAGDYQERDLFSSYMTGARWVVGDPKALKEASPADRIAIAHQFASEWDPNPQQNWSAYCSTDPEGAFEALRSGPLDEANAGLWLDLVGSLAWPRGDESAEAQSVRQEMTRKVLTHLRGADEPLLARLAARLVDLLPAARYGNMEAADWWWDHLWTLLENDPEPIQPEAGGQFYDRVINRPAGRLTEHLIRVISSRKTKKRRVSSADRDRLRRVFDSETPAGWWARGACANQLTFLLYIDRVGALGRFRPWLSRLDEQGAALRSVMVEYCLLDEAVTRSFKNEVLRGVVESQASDSLAAHVASRLLRPLFSQAAHSGKTDWGLRSEDVRVALRQVSPSILEGAAECFRVWVTPADKSPERAWIDAVRPVFESVWPQEARFKRSSHARDLAWLCVASGRRFSEALEVVRPFLAPFDQDWVNLHFVSASKAPENHPETMLDLLWAICGPESRGQSTELGNVLDRIAAKRPQLVRDRRFQWLNQRAVRFG